MTGNDADSETQIGRFSHDDHSKQRLHYWILAKPDLNQPTGGVKQIHRLAEGFGKLNRRATLIQEDASFHPGWFASKVNTISEEEWLNKCDINPATNILILPETYGGDLFDYAPNLGKIIFNQNGAYSFGPPEEKWMHRPGGLMDLYRHPIIKHILCVSDHDHELISYGFQTGENRVSKIQNAIEADIFKPYGKKVKQLCYMPRKNVRDSLVVIEMLRRHKWFKNWKIVQIKHETQSAVAEIMRKSLIFLSFGHPEGFGLPVAEAMASGCHVVGYSGLGGRELFQLGQQQNTCKEIAVGDWMGYIKEVERINSILEENPQKQIELLLKCSKIIREKYSQEAMLKSLENAIELIENQSKTNTML